MSQRLRTILFRAGVGAAALSLPWWLSPGWFTVALLTLFATIGAASLNFLTGVLGQVSLGHGAFIAVGAFSAAVLAHLGIGSLLVAMVAGTVIAGALGLLTAVPAFRLHGFYLALATLGVQFATVYGLLRLQHHLVGSSAFRIPLATVAGWTLRTDTHWYFLVLPIAVLTLYLFGRIKASRFGRACLMVRDAEQIAPVFGINPRRIKTLVFIVASAAAGLQGAMFGYYIGSVHAESFTLLLAVQYLAMIVIGGLGTAIGSLYGAAFVTSLSFVLRQVGATYLPALSGGVVSNLALGTYGLATLVGLIYQPAGIAGIVAGTRRRLAGWKGAYAAGRRTPPSGENTRQAYPSDPTGPKDLGYRTEAPVGGTAADDGDRP